LLAQLGSDRQDWLANLWETYQVEQEPLLGDDGEILAEPLFWFKKDGRLVACFGCNDPGPHTLHKLEDNGIAVIRPGQELPHQEAERLRQEQERQKRDAERAVERKLLADGARRNAEKDAKQTDPLKAPWSAASATWS
jgi:hypothetical protein